MHIFLDDWRDPGDVRHVYLPDLEWMVIRTPQAFNEILSTAPELIETVSFDYHLDHNFITGLTCLSWLLDVRGDDPPICYYHSSDPKMCDKMKEFFTWAT